LGSRQDKRPHQKLNVSMGVLAKKCQKNAFSCKLMNQRTLSSGHAYARFIQIKAHLNLFLGCTNVFYEKMLNSTSSVEL
jgi:hypothetical protein